MDNLILTIILSLILMVLVIAGLAAGLLLTGKSRLKRGCGYIPKPKQDNKTEGESSCPLCGESEICKTGKDKNDSSNSRSSD